MGMIDGRKVVFELGTNVTQKPKTSRRDRVRRRYQMINSKRTHFEQRLRFWLMHFSVAQLSVTFLGVFVAMCAVFAGLFSMLEEGCCSDAGKTFTDMFAFSVQTAATIGTSFVKEKRLSILVRTVSASSNYSVCHRLWDLKSIRHGTDYVVRPGPFAPQPFSHFFLLIRRSKTFWSSCLPTHQSW